MNSKSSDYLMNAKKTSNDTEKNEKVKQVPHCCLSTKKLHDNFYHTFSPHRHQNIIRLFYLEDVDLVGHIWKSDKN